VRALTGKNPSNAARRRDMLPSLIQQCWFRDIVLSLIFCPVVYNLRPRRSPGRGFVPKIEMKRKKSRWRDSIGIRLALLISRNLLSDRWWFTGTSHWYLSNLRTYGTVMAQSSSPRSHFARLSAKLQVSRKSRKKICDADYLMYSVLGLTTIDFVKILWERKI